MKLAQNRNVCIQGGAGDDSDPIFTFAYGKGLFFLWFARLDPLRKGKPVRVESMLSTTITSHKSLTLI